MNDFDATMMSKEELEELLTGKVNPVEFNRIIACYEISDNAFAKIKFIDGSPYFYHITRVVRIIISELQIFDPDIIIAALLHDYKRVEEVISKDILEFNFGPYLLYLVELLSMPVEEASDIPNEFRLSDLEMIRMPIDDYLIIKLAEQIDYFRSLDFDLNYNPVINLCEINKKFLPIAGKSNHKSVKYMIAELNMLKNKIIG